MAYTIKRISETEIRVNDTFIHQDQDKKWVATPPIESQAMQKAVNNYIKGLENGE